MLNSISIPVRDFDESRKFYDAIMSALEYEHIIFNEGDSISYGKNTAELWLKQAAGDVCKGVSLSINAFNDQNVRDFHAAALSMGGQSVAEPASLDGLETYYSAIIIDPNGYQIEALCVSS